MTQYKADILVVDDTPHNLRLLFAVLAEQGYKVRSVLSGEMALTVTQTVTPDLILLDILMPGINGYEVCQALKANSALAGIPVIFLSAMNDQIDVERAYQVGGVDYISKPFIVEEVIEKVAKHVKPTGSTN